MHMLLGSINKMVLINSLLWPRVLATLWSAVLFEIMCARKQIHCRGMTALSSTPPLRMLFLYPAETQHLRLTWLDLFRNNLLLCCLVLAWHPGGKNKQKNNRNIISWQLSLRSHFSVIVSPLSLYQYSVCICLCAEAQSNAAQRLTDGWLMRRWCRFKGVAKRRKCRCAIKMQIIKICIQLIPSSAGSGNIDAFVMKTPWSLAPVFSRAAAALKISRVIISGFSLQQLCLRKCHLSHSLCVLEILILVYNGTWNNKVR